MTQLEYEFEKERRELWKKVYIASFKNGGSTINWLADNALASFDNKFSNYKRRLEQHKDPDKL